MLPIVTQCFELQDQLNAEAMLSLFIAERLSTVQTHAII